MIEKYQNKEWLEKKYIGEKLSTHQIAKLCGVNDTTIGNWLRRFGISIRSHVEAAELYRRNSREDRKYYDRQWLYQKYIEEKLSITKIAEICGVGCTTIKYWLKKYSIPIRSESEAVHLALANHCNLTQKAREWINGELLGDGCLMSPSPYSAMFQYGSKYREYIQYVSDTLKSFGIEQAGKIIKRQDKRWECHFYQYCSRCYVELLAVRKRWYPYGKKIIPRDIKLSPITLRQHFIGDGSLGHLKYSRPYIRLSTNSFPIPDVEWLVEQLNKLGFKSKRQLSSNIIRISAYSTKEFLNYLGNCPASCYRYKFNY